MIALGETNIVKAYLGSTELKNVVIGEHLLLNSAPIINVRIIDSIMTSDNYVDTGIVANDRYYTFVGRFIKGTRLSYASWGSFFGNYQNDNTPKYRIMRRSNMEQLSISGWQINNNAVAYTEADVDFTLSFNTVTIKGAKYSFNKSLNNNQNTTTIKIYFSSAYITTWTHLQTSHNNKVIQDLYPCVDENDLCGFVDIKTGTVFYPNTPIPLSSQTQLQT